MLLTPEMIDMMLDSFIETLIMVGIAGVIGGAIGIPLGILLHVTSPQGILPTKVMRSALLQSFGWALKMSRICCTT